MSLPRETIEMLREKLFTALYTNGGIPRGRNDKKVARMIREAAAAGFPINCADINRSGETLLHVAIYTNRIECIETLIKLGADINIRDIRGATPFYVACRREKLEIAKILIDAGCDVNITPRNRFPPLDMLKAVNKFVWEDLTEHIAQRYSQARIAYEDEEPAYVQEL